MRSMFLSRLLTGASLAACAAAPLPLHAIPASIANNYELVWWDEFDGTTLNSDYWEHELGARRNAVNAENAVTVANGSAVITTYTEGGVHYTGFIKTKEKFSQAFGYYEARIQFNDAPGMWSAFWLMPHELPTKLAPELLDHPDYAGVEIDIAEHRKVKGNGQNIENIINTALHWNGYSKGDEENPGDHRVDAKETTHPTLTPGTWHTYGVLWTPEGCSFYFDNQLVRHTQDTTDAVSHRSSHVLLSSEIKHESWAGLIPAGGYGSRAASTVRMLTDYVRVYQLKPSASGQSPSVAHPFPGRIEAENFDNGGRNVAYYEMVGSGPGGGVDVVTATTSSGGRHVGHADKPEWLEHTVAAQTPGYYSARLRLATSDIINGETRLSIDGLSLGTVMVRDTGGWRDLSLPALLKVESNAAFVAKTEFMRTPTTGMTFNFDAIDFVRLGNVAHFREAEGGALSGGALLSPTGDNSNVHASGKRSVDLNTTGAAVSWTGVNGFNGGAATLTLRYCTKGVPAYDRPCQLLVNGTPVPTLPPLPTTSFNGFVNITQAITLNAGTANTIELRYTGLPGRSLFIDYLVTSREQAGVPVAKGPDAFPSVRPAANRLADGETAVTLVSDDFTNGATTGWTASHERLLDPATGVTLSNVTGSGLDGRALSVASTVQFRSALRAFDPVTLAIGDSLTVSFDYRLPDGVWNNAANGLVAGFANSAEVILRDPTLPDTSGNRAWPAFSASANPAGQAGGSWIAFNQGNGTGRTLFGTAYGTAATGTTRRSATVTFTRTGANSLEITSNLGRFGMTPDKVTATVTTNRFTFDRFFVTKGAGSANLRLFLDNVQVVHHGAAGQ